MKLEKFWKVIEKTSQIVAILGIITIALLLVESNKKSKQEKANEKIIEAIAIFKAANNPTDYQRAYEIFLEAKDLPNDLTGYYLFLELSERMLDNRKKINFQIMLSFFFNNMKKQ